MVFSHEAVKVHGQLVVIQPIAHDVVTVLQQDGEAQEEHEWVPSAKLLGWAFHGIAILSLSIVMEYLSMYSGQFSARVYNFQRASLVIVSTSMAKCGSLYFPYFSMDQ